MVRVRDRGGEPVALPGLAPVAMQQGRYTASVVRTRDEGANTAPSATATRATWPRSGEQRQSPTSRRPGQRLSRVGDLAARPPPVPDRLPESAARPHPLVVQLRNPRSR